MEKQPYSLQWLLEELALGQTMKYVLFWGHRPKSKDRVGKSCFSQWFPAPFTVDGLAYPTAEHWMMAEKARLFNDDTALQKIIANAKPGAAKAYGREVLNFNSKVWDAHKFEIAVAGNVHKFSQNPALETFLINTHNRVLVEASPVDMIWGTGLAQDNDNADDPAEWTGLNLLGFALMETRDILQAR